MGESQSVWDQFMSEVNLLMNHVGEKHFYKNDEYNSWYPCISVDGLLLIWTLMISFM